MKKEDIYDEIKDYLYDLVKQGKKNAEIKESLDFLKNRLNSVLRRKREAGEVLKGYSGIDRRKISKQIDR